jgi:hypothetical protein
VRRMTRKGGNGLPIRSCAKEEAFKTAREFLQAPAFAQYGPTREEET